MKIFSSIRQDHENILEFNMEPIHDVILAIPIKDF